MNRYCMILAVLLLSFSSCAVSADDDWSLQPRALVIVVDPFMNSVSGETLVEHYRWNDSNRLAQKFVEDITTATHGQVQFEIAETIIDHDWPPFLDNVAPFEGETFKHAWEGKREFPGKCGYAAILEKHGVRDKIESGQIDEVWMFGFPGMGCYETRMAGEGAIWCNGPVIEDFPCSRPFVVYGFNYERDVDCMLEDLGHRAESMLAHVFRDAGPDSAWARFTRYDKTHPGEAGCGNVHFAPNSQSNYDWGNPASVDSTCDDWALNFPALNGLKKRVNAEEWGNGDMRLHHLWWFARFPHHSGEFEGKLANWWKYIFAWDAYQNS
ncbi:MAG: hypothetical protein ACD_39C00686G0002 [uncultured bacterium]|nr:MAG: hypothetical protein ACD_39C00686G0002 [uncultured bacterium]